MPCTYCVEQSGNDARQINLGWSAASLIPNHRNAHRAYSNWVCANFVVLDVFCHSEAIHQIDTISIWSFWRRIIPGIDGGSMLSPLFRISEDKLAGDFISASMQNAGTVGCQVDLTGLHRASRRNYLPIFQTPTRKIPDYSARTDSATLNQVVVTRQ